MACKDETGNKYGKLTVLNRDYSKPKSNKNAYWLCQCDCGNQTIVIGTKLRSGETKSCGCLKKENGKSKIIDLTNQKFGRLTILERAASTSQGMAQWKCQCECGNIVIVTGSNLRRGHTQSCGCLQKEKIANTTKIDITNHRYGKLTALEPTQERRGSNTIWRCICDCGQECFVDINSLNQGKTSSCGCLSVSLGEFKIAEILNENNINFTTEQSFEGCRFEDTNALARFDFYVNNHYLIEFDGIQHFEYKNDNGWNNKENYQRTIQHDKIKNQWCKDNGIPLIRIPYTHLKQLSLKDLILETSNFIVKEN